MQRSLKRFRPLSGNHYFKYYPGGIYGTEIEFPSPIGESLFQITTTAIITKSP